MCIFQQENLTYHHNRLSIQIYEFLTLFALFFSFNGVISDYAIDYTAVTRNFFQHKSQLGAHRLQSNSHIVQTT